MPYCSRSSSGTLAIFTAIRRASSLLSNLAASLIADPRVGGRGRSTLLQRPNISGAEKALGYDRICLGLD
jgi:hypothetical protein